MKDLLLRIWTDLVGRIGGPMTFRLILQPMVAGIVAIRAGLADGRAGKPLYFWSIFSDPLHRREIIREGWKHVAKIFVAAILIDLVYQLIVFRWFYPLQAFLVAVPLAILPYLVIRGLTNRIARRRPHAPSFRTREGH
jgi:hypothetical protein